MSSGSSVGTVYGYTCASCGAWISHGNQHSCTNWQYWPYWPTVYPTRVEQPPYEQQPECPEDDPPKLYRCKKGHWHPFPKEE